jgi:hypothetical protein
MISEHEAKNIEVTVRILCFMTHNQRKKPRTATRTCTSTIDVNDHVHAHEKKSQFYVDVNVIDVFEILPKNKKLPAKYAKSGVSA